MNSFYLDVRDPLFGIIVFFALIFVIAFFSYWFNSFKKDEDQKDIEKFLKQFAHSGGSGETVSELDSQKTQLLLAGFYSKEASYEKSIDIYIHLLKDCDATSHREILFLLGVAYYRAGFLERSKAIFLEILKQNPRTPQALSYLLFIYEQMKKYKEALEVLESLEEVGCGYELEASFIKIVSLKNDLNLSMNEKVVKLLEIYDKTRTFAHFIFDYLFVVDPKEAWKHLDILQAPKIADILWRCQKSDVDFEVVRRSSFLMELYSAKGYVQDKTSSSIFEFDTLMNLSKSSSATLGFEYVCRECKHIFPFAFYRCSHCHTLDSMELEFLLVRDYYKEFDEENNSFL